MKKVAIVTGAASGIGAATVAELERQDWTVIGADLAYNSFGHRVGSDGFDAGLDIRSPSEWSDLIDAISLRSAGIDLLVNCAAMLRDSPLIELDPEELDRHFQVNVLGTFLGMQAIARHMTGSGNGGAIINVASVSGLIAHADRGAYAASKWALRGLSQTAALEWARFGIRVCTVIPGPIDTPMSRAARGHDPSVPFGNANLPQVPLNRFGQASEVAGMIAWLASPAATYVTGSEFVIDGGFLLGT